MSAVSSEQPPRVAGSMAPGPISIRPATRHDVQLILDMIHVRHNLTTLDHRLVFTYLHLYHNNIPLNSDVPETLASFMTPVSLF